MGPTAFAQSDETAMAIPRLAPYDGTGVALPRPLAAPDAALLARLFAAPAAPQGQLLRLASGLDRTVLNDAMLGHVLAARYLGAARRTSAPELADWLGRHAGLPDAPAIAALLQRRDRQAVIPPGLARDPVAAVPAVPEEIDPPGRAIARNPLLDATIHARLHDGEFDAALRLIAHTRGLSAEYGALLRAEVAQALFTRNRDEQALALARQASRQAHGQIGLADYVAGLAAWRLGMKHEATEHFAASSRAQVATAAQLAAAAFWAARGSLAAGDTALYRQWLLKAGDQHRTFYGQMARRLTGRPDGLAFEHAVLGEADVTAIAADPAGLRAFALLQLGQTARAGAELRLLVGAGQNPGLTRAAMLVAERAGLFDLAADFATQMQMQGAPALDSDRFAVPRLRPGHGFLMDPALVYALTRIESNFDPAAVSAMGAQGLMQIMPHTAGYVAARAEFGPGRASAGRSGFGRSGAAGEAPRLHDPATNLDLGQRYVAYLAGHDIVDGDLIRLLVSYNSGPGAFGRWADAVHDDGDPLLFIEAIPTDETRAFVQRALAYTWIYAARLHLRAPSLEALAHGRFPRFSAARPTLVPVVLH